MMNSSLRKRLGAMTASAALALAPASASAQLSWAAEGPYTRINLRGLQLHCLSNYGEVVDVFIDPELNNVGIASRWGGVQPYIVLNPQVLNQYSDTVAVWWFSHECAHHALGAANSEPNADCFGVRRMRDLGMLNNYGQLQAFVYELRNLQGSPMGHLPGPIRAANIINCALS
jgi:hypothetical protein